MAESARLAVLGSPISHSRSPALHAAAYRVLGLDWSYVRVELEEPQLGPFLAGLDTSWRGLSLTMPLKREAARLADTLDAPARLTGSVNTLLLPSASGGLRGFNTDVGGIVAAVRASGVERTGEALVVGSGATAASAVPACAALGTERIVVVARSVERAEALKPLAQATGMSFEARPIDGSFEGLAPDLVINTVPGEAAAAAPWPEATRSRALLLDVPYDPWPGPLASAWVVGGGRVLSGLAMLVHQALLQVRVFVAGDPEAEVPFEREVLDTMLSAVGLDAAGTPAR